MKTKKPTIVSVAVLFLSIYYIWFCMPFFRYTFATSFFKAFFFACFIIGLLCLALNYFMQTKWKLDIKSNILMPIIVYMLLMAVFAVFDFHDAQGHIRVSFTFWGSAIVYYLFEKAPEQRRKFVQFLIFILIVNSITSYLGLLSNDRAARALTNASRTTEALETDYILARMNICSIELYQSLVILAPVLVMFIKNKKHRIFSLGCMIFTVLIITKASFAICMLMLLMGIAVSLLDIKGIRAQIILPIVCLFLYMLPWGEIFHGLSSIITNEQIAARFSEIGQMISIGEMVGGLESRVQVYQASLETFLSHPFGIGPYYSYVAFADGLGYHSQMLDDMGRYGIFAILFYFIFLKEYYAMLKKKWNIIDMQSVCFPIVVVYMGFLLLNLAFRSGIESIVVFLILPTLPDLLYENKDLKVKSI